MSDNDEPIRNIVTCQIYKCLCCMSSICLLEMAMSVHAYTHFIIHATKMSIPSVMSHVRNAHVNDSWSKSVIIKLPVLHK